MSGACAGSNRQPSRFSPLNLASFVLGALLVALAVFTLWASQRRRLPLWAAPVGLALFACGAALCLRVVLVDAYPTSYWANPEPSDSTAVQQGEALFRTHCASCHGSEGRGDGPAAAALAGPPADLTAEHVDDHTDGDILWWLTYGMAGTAMPGFEQDVVGDRTLAAHPLRAQPQGPAEEPLRLRCTTWR